MAHTPLKMTIEQTQEELERAWAESYSPERIEQALASISDQPINDRLIHFIMRLFFRGIYFPQMTKSAWLKVIAQNRKPIFKLTREAVGKYREARKRRAQFEGNGAHTVINKEETGIIREG
jgi:hypothetical protein